MGICGSCFPDNEAMKRKRQMRTLQYATDLQKADKNFVLDKVKKNGLELKWANVRLTRDRDVVEAAVQQNLLALEHASEKFRQDTEIVRASIKRDKGNWQYVGQVLGSDEQLSAFVLDCVKLEKLDLQDMPEKLRTRDVMLEAVKRNGLALRLASEELRQDRQIVLEAVKRDGRAWQYASAELREDEVVLMEAVRRDEVAKGKNKKTFDHDPADDDGADIAVWWGAQDLCSDREVALEALIKQGTNTAGVRAAARTA